MDISLKTTHIISRNWTRNVRMTGEAGSLPIAPRPLLHKSSNWLNLCGILYLSPICQFNNVILRLESLFFSFSQLVSLVTCSCVSCRYWSASSRDTASRVAIFQPRQWMTGCAIGFTWSLPHTKRWAISGLTLAQRLWRRPNIKPALAKSLCLPILSPVTACNRIPCLISH